MAYSYEMVILDDAIALLGPTASALGPRDKIPATSAQSTPDPANGHQT